jgi:acyl-CoA thioesterase FadM
VLDEVMGKVCRFRGVRAVTAELSIEYLKPVLVDVDLAVEGYEVKMKGRNLFLAGEIRGASGEVLARGKGRFVIISPKQAAKDDATKHATQELAGKPLEK